MYTSPELFETLINTKKGVNGSWYSVLNCMASLSDQTLLHMYRNCKEADNKSLVGLLRTEIERRRLNQPVPAEIIPV